jgi:AcrR family transcriptional regulator
MTDTIVKRRYRSPLRQAQAEATRQRILDAGLELFAKRGYAATSIARIARVAGVSPETIYASVGSKRGIIDALLDQIDSLRVGDQLAAQVQARDGTPRAAIDAIARTSARFWADNGVLVGVLRSGIGDAEIGEAWRARQGRRRDVLRSIFTTWSSEVLRPGIDAERAADIGWALTSHEVYALLVGLRGWSFEAFVTWESDTLARELLVETPPQGST